MDAETEYQIIIDAILRKGTGYLIWKGSIRERLVKETGMSLRVFEEYIRSCLRGENKLHQKPEERDDWKDHYDFMYWMILPLFDRFKKGYFVEFRCEDDEPDSPVVMIVNGHEQIG